MRAARATAAAALALASTAAPAHVLFDRTTLRQWAQECAALVVAELDGDARMWQAADGSDRQDWFRARVIESLHGGVAPGALDFFPHAEGFPAFRAGDRVLLFLERSAERPEFASLAARFAWFSMQGAGQEWKLEPGPAGDAVLEVARRLADQRARPPANPRDALRDLVLAELASGVPRLRRDALAELVRARAWPGFLDADSTPVFAAWLDGRKLPTTERLALVRLLEGAPGFDADARLRAMTREPLVGPEMAQLVRVAGSRSDPALRSWLADLSDDPRPDVQREARAALATRH
jgi:hypothetical protein